MDAPNKIYLNEDGYGVQTVWSTYPSDIQPSHEYIRKDALLEWAKKQYREYANNPFYAGERDAFTQLIKKINSL